MNNIFEKNDVPDNICIHERFMSLDNCWYFWIVIQWHKNVHEWKYFPVRRSLYVEYYLLTNGYFSHARMSAQIVVLCSFIVKRLLTAAVYGLAVGPDVVGLVLWRWYGLLSALLTFRNCLSATWLSIVLWQRGLAETILGVRLSSRKMLS